MSKEAFYLAGAHNLQEFLARLMVVQEQERLNESKARLAGAADRAAFHAARGSGMNEVAEALQQYLWRPPSVVPMRRVSC